MRKNRCEKTDAKKHMLFNVHNSVRNIKYIFIKTNDLWSFYTILFTLFHKIPHMSYQLKNISALPRI